MVIVLVAIAIANLVAIRAGRPRSVVLLGCGTLVIGLVTAVGVLVLLVTMN